MTAKEYLEQMPVLDKAINEQLDLRDHYMNMATKTGASLSLTWGKSGNYNHSRVEDYTIKLADLDRKINANMGKLYDLRCELMGLIGQIKDTRHQMLLEYRYVNGWMWDKVAKELDKSRTYTYKLHNDALAAFEEIYGIAQTRYPMETMELMEISKKKGVGM